jgi:hypothetical protein
MTACLVEHVEQNGSSACRLAEAQNALQLDSGFVEAAGLCELAGVGVALGGALDVLAVVLAGVPWSASKQKTRGLQGDVALPIDYPA